MANNINPVVPWSDLPQELVELIMAHVTTTFDLLRCRGVCHSWRSAVLNVLSLGVTSTTPLLLLYNRLDLCNSPAKLLCLGKNTTTKYRLRSPNMKRLSYKDGVIFNRTSPDLVKSMEKHWMADDEGIEEEADSGNGGGGGAVPKRTRCIAPCRGWLLLYPYYESSLYLFNPLSRMVVHLPPPPELKMVTNPDVLRFIISSIPTDPTCMVYLYTPNQIAVYKLGDRKWTPVFASNHHEWVSVIFYHGNFYSIDELGVLRRFLLDKSYSNYKEEEVCNGTCNVNQYRYLVEGSWSGELLMVVRIYEHQICRTKTKSFEIFKLNWSNGKWEEVSNLGHRALFLTTNDSKFVSVRYNPEYTPNSIYFIEDTNTRMKDFGVYDLATRNIKPLHPSQNHMQRAVYYRWFQPVP
ncbi:F-box protein At2g05970-like [Cornus florida]|uniref:F-box protein At2g05970-like n=1 Tax=Cornus florida TaxID=4283 RepID=UPI0028986ACA|nr:F-box protein At2g05970-like [Cornus florida]XP_059669316.1 F-box protein At2g05970-like [Cornus florida]